MQASSKPGRVRNAWGGPWGANRSISLFGSISLIVALTLAALSVYPMSQVIVRLVYSDGRFTLRPLAAALQLPDFVELIINTVTIVGASSAVALLVGSLLAWLNEKTDARVGIFTDSMPLIPFLLPPVAGAIGWVLLLSPRAGLLNAWLRDLVSFIFGVSMREGPFDIHTWYGLIFVFVIYQVPYVFLMVTAGLRGLDPSLEEQSRISGASWPTTLRKVTLPALGPSLGAAVLLMAWQGFALFSVPVIIGTPAGIDVLAVRIVRVLSFTFPPQTDVALGLSAVIVVFVGTTWYAQTRILRRGRFATIGGKSHRVTRIRLGAWKWPVRLVVILYVVIAAVLPLGALVIVSLNGFWSSSVQFGNLSLDSLRSSVFDNPMTRRALVNSVNISVVTATIGMLVAAIISMYLLRSRSRWSRGLDATIKLPAVISNVVLAVGFLLAFAGPPFNLGGTLLILGLAYLVLYFPQGSVASDAAAGLVGEELAEASRVAGAGRGRTFRKIHIPLMLAGLAAGWALLFARMVGDLTASAILAGTRNPVVGYRILDTYNNGSFADLASLATVLVAITLGVVLIAFMLSRRQTKWGAAPPM